MEQYRVKALSVSGLSNKVHHLNELVTAKNFPGGTVPRLVEKGFLEKTDGKDHTEVSLGKKEEGSPEKGTGRKSK